MDFHQNARYSASPCECGGSRALFPSRSSRRQSPVYGWGMVKHDSRAIANCGLRSDFLTVVHLHLSSVRREAQFRPAVQGSSLAAALPGISGTPAPAIKPARGGRRGVSPRIDLRVCWPTGLSRSRQSTQRFRPSELKLSGNADVVTGRACLRRQIYLQRIVATLSHAGMTTALRWPEDTTSRKRRRWIALVSHRARQGKS